MRYDAQWDRIQKCQACFRELRYKVVESACRVQRNAVVHFAHCHCGHLRPSTTVGDLQSQYAEEHEHAMIIGEGMSPADRAAFDAMPPMTVEHQEAFDEDLRKRLRDR